MCYSCEPYYCKFVSTNENVYLQHIASHVSSQNTYGCFVCNKKFENFDNLFNHIKETYTKIEFECICCAIYFRSKSQFDEHKCENTNNLDKIRHNADRMA